MPHGETKTPGGKLAMVDLAIHNHTLADVRIRGDFFLHPESATTTTLNAVAEALNGAPADADTSALAARIQAAIPFGVELIGTTPEAIALAVRRAVTGNADFGEAPALNRIGAFAEAQIGDLTHHWKKLPWQILPEVPRSPQENSALDEVLVDAVAAGTRYPTLRFWRWTHPAVIIGRCQSVSNEVDLPEAKARGIEIVRRMTGGGAMFLQPHGAITYSLYLPEENLKGLSIRQSYEVCEAWLIKGLRELGVDAHHVPINDIACGEGKIGGAAQARRKGVVLHHTTLAYDMDPGEMVKVLRIGREKLKDKAIASAQKRVSPLVRQTGLSREAIVAHLLKSFQGYYGGLIAEVTAEELDAMKALVTTKYATPEWTNEFD